MRSNYFDFERYLLAYDRCSPCEQLADLICAIPGLLRRWRQRHRGRADLGGLTFEELRDIGVTSSEAALEYCKPFWRG